MSVLSREDDDVEILNLTVKVPRHLPFGIAESLEESVALAVQILTDNDGFSELYESANKVAQVVVSQVRPGSILLEDRVAQMATMNKVFEEGDWLTADEINALQPNPPAKKSLPASDWKRRGRIFCVTYDDKDYYPRYQFDAMYQPLPIIKEVLSAYGEYADPWSVAAWFHFPNGWIAREVGDTAVPVAPKDALNRTTDVIEAARNQKGTYVA
jgi:hypothetical protein